VVVLEIVLGILVGPDLLGFAEPDDFLDFFSSLGLGMLFFFAGYEIDFERIRGSPLKLGALGWLLSLTGLILSLLFTGSALCAYAPARARGKRRRPERARSAGSPCSAADRHRDELPVPRCGGRVGRGVPAVGARPTDGECDRRAGRSNHSRAAPEQPLALGAARSRS
jgi:Sodium/hydrogen exchanger family